MNETSTLSSRLKHAWNIFLNNKDPTEYGSYSEGSYSYRPDRPRVNPRNDKSIVTAICNRIAVDVSLVDIKHVYTDGEGRYLEDVKSDLNECLTVEANLDQTARAFVVDMVLSMLDEGNIAVVPVDTDLNPALSNTYKIRSLRTGKIIQWYPDAVKVRLYDERKGIKKDIIVKKKSTAILENPFYAVMNETNSTMQRLIRKLALLDAVDEYSSSEKMNMIIQLPYAIKTELKREQVEKRRQDLENQLTKSKYGIAYADSTEKIIQLGRPVENGLLGQIQYLTDMLYGQLGFTAEILNGTANEATMINYTNRILEPILLAITDEFKRKFITKTARTQGQTIMFFEDPFRLTPMSQMADLGDRFTRNEIMTSNEMRQKIGMKPSQDPNADMLRNKNISMSNQYLPGEENQVYDYSQTSPEEGQAPEEAYGNSEYSEYEENQDPSTIGEQYVNMIFNS